MQRIAQILLSPRIGGAETLATSLEREWRSRGIASQIIYLDQKGQEKSRVRRVRELRRRLREFAPDAVIAHSYLPSLYARVVWGSRAPVHSVLHSASDDFDLLQSRLVERALGSRTASVIAVSQQQVDAYRGRFPTVRITRIANGVSEAVESRRDFNDVPRRVVTIARVAAQKRPEFWHAVTNEMHRRYPEVLFEWWGPLSGDDALDRHVSSGRGTGRYMGVTGDPGAVLSTADILFHPSAREAHSIALLEGAVAGLPVVYADSIARPDANPVWDWRFEGQKVSAAVEMLERIVKNWRDTASAAVAYAPHARSRYGMTEVADQYLVWIAADRA